MFYKKHFIVTAIFLLLASALLSFIYSRPADDDFVAYTVNPGKTVLKIYWKDDTGKPLKSLQALKEYCAARKEQLVFGMNGGMYKEDNSPLGLYIQEGKKLAAINKRTGKGNFYMQPNGILYITSNKVAAIGTTNTFTDNGNIEYATQSGPMLVIDGNINPHFKKGSANTNIRNGVGILPGNRLLFAMSKKETSFYDFAHFFKQAGCNNALYLDGFVSRTYLPEKNWLQTDGNFGVMIGAVTKQ